jgi:ubiquinone/menaquinone biosynthesis C-methylase UbiE
MTVPEPTGQQRVHFDDGAAYERMMGTWSRLAGEVFLDWLALRPGLQCLDVGCGNGAFTELLVERCAPAEVQGIDPAPAQLDFARERLGTGIAEFRQGDALALPFPDNRFDAAIMALVIFFVPDPQKSVREMARVVRPGGVVATYAWDMTGGGSPVDPIQQELIALGQRAARAPMADASRIAALNEMWSRAGLERIETRTIPVRRTFVSFEELWTVTLAGTAVAQTIAAMPPSDAETAKARVRAKFASDAGGRVTYGALANAVKGYVPA